VGDALERRFEKDAKNTRRKNMKLGLTKALVLFAACCALLILSTPNQASAQGRYRDDRYDRRGRDRDYQDRDYRGWEDRDSRDREWGRRSNRRDVENIIKRVEESSDRFTKAFDRNLDRSRLNGSSLEDRLNHQVKRLEDELDDLRDDFDRRDDWRETRQRVQNVMREADSVNRIMHNGRFHRDVEAMWSYVKRDLNRLAGIYNLRSLR